MTRAFEGGSSWGFRCPVNGGHRIVFRNARYGHLLDKFNYPVGKGRHEDAVGPGSVLPPQSSPFGAPPRGRWADDLAPGLAS
jgi:hypothetical protein